MSAAAGAHGEDSDRIYAGRISLIHSAGLALAEKRRHPARHCICRKCAVHDGRLHVPYAPSGHVCQLHAVPDPFLSVYPEKKISLAAALPDAYLPEQLLLFRSRTSRRWVVLVQDRRERIFPEIFPQRICAGRSAVCGNGGGSAHPHRACPAGTPQERVRRQSGGTVRP